MAARLVDIVLGAAEDDIEWTVCKRHETADVSTQTNKEGSELRSIVYKMVHGSTTFQLLEEYGDVFVEHYANIMSIASKMRLDAYQHLKLKIDMEKGEKERKEKDQRDQKEKERGEQGEQKERKEREKGEQREQKEKEQKEKEQKERKAQREKEQREQRERKERLKKKKERMRRLAQMAKKRKTTPLNTRLNEFEEFAATPINVTNPFDF